MVAWEKLEIETELEKRLIEEFQPQQGNTIYGHYTAAREYLLGNLLEDIKIREPNLTDHGPRHIANVLNNAFLLLGGSVSELTGNDLYILCVSILFHDVGNLNGRTGHNKEISEFFDLVRKETHYFLSEKLAVMSIAGAHSGFAKDSTKDTLQDLNGRCAVNGKMVQAQNLAAILRFADELAEGPQRTSAYMVNHKKYDPASQIYHIYAQSLDSFIIDRNGGRIALTINTILTIHDKELWLTSNGKYTVSLKDFLVYAYDRIIKVDQERRYNKYYCDLLSPFKETSAVFTFCFLSENGGTRMSEFSSSLNPIILNDLVVPGQYQQPIPEIYSGYKISNILEQLWHECDPEI